eukprot:12235562-Heterocapsa_arctica.AAC.1
MINMLKQMKTKLNAAAFEQRDKKKQQQIVNCVALMAQQSLILTELQKEDLGNPAINCCMGFGNANIQEDDVEMGNIKIALGLAAE